MLDYDLLSLDTGPVMDRDALPGAREHGLFVRPIEHFVELFERLRALAETRSLEVVVIGAGAAGVELALALVWRLGPTHNVSLVSGDVEPLDGFADAFAGAPPWRCGGTASTCWPRPAPRSRPITCGWPTAPAWPATRR